MAKQHPIKIMFYGSENSGVDDLLDDITSYLEAKGLNPKPNFYRNYITLPEDYTVAVRSTVSNRE